MAMANLKNFKAFLAEASKALGRNPTDAELARLLQGDNSVLSKNKPNEKLEK